jgi:hypothetical protein
LRFPAVDISLQRVQSLLAALFSSKQRFRVSFLGCDRQLVSAVEELAGLSQKEAQGSE